MATGKNGQSEPGVKNPGFASGIPGLTFKPVAHEVRKKTQQNLSKSKDLFKEYDALSRTIRVINRAEQGPLKGKAFLGCFAGELWPDEVDGNDEETWLQPGTYMDVPKEVAFHLVGNVWDKSLPDKQSIINRYGGPQFKAPSNDVVSGRGAPMVVVGPPQLPDLIVIEVNSRGTMTGEPKYVYELYTRGLVGTEVTIGEEAADEEPEAVLTTAP